MAACCHWIGGFGRARGGARTFAARRRGHRQPWCGKRIAWAGSPRRCRIRRRTRRSYDYLRRRRRVLHANEAAVAAFGAMRPGLSLLLRFRAPEMQALIEQLLGRRKSGADRFSSNACPSSASSAVGGRDRAGQGSVRARLQGTRARRAASTACAPISSPMPATNCARRWPRSPASSRRCAGRRATTPAARDQFLKIMQGQTGRMARLIDDLLSLSRLEMKPSRRAGSRWTSAEIVRASSIRSTPLARETGVVDRDTVR